MRGTAPVNWRRTRCSLVRFDGSIASLLGSSFAVSGKSFVVFFRRVNLKHLGNSDGIASGIQAWGRLTTGAREEQQAARQQGAR